MKTVLCALALGACGVEADDSDFIGTAPSADVELAARTDALAATDDQLDATFYGAGRQRAYHAQPITNTALTVSTDKKIYVGGFYQSTLAGKPMKATVGRLDVNGGFDSWGAGEKVLLKNNYEVMSMISAGTTVVLGISTTDTHQGVVSKLLKDGVTPDASFGTGGEFHVAVPGRTNALVSALAAAPEGKIVVGGTAFNFTNGLPSSQVVYVMRLNANGTRDTSFAIATIKGGTNGWVPHKQVRLAIGTGRKDVYVALQTISPFVAHITSAGLLDTGFSHDGVLTMGLGIHDITARGDDGSVYVAEDDADGITIVQVRIDGTLNPAFTSKVAATRGVKGASWLDYPGFDYINNQRVRYSDTYRTLFVGGDSYKSAKDGNIFVFAAIKPDGNPDTSFNNDGFWTTDFYTLADTQTFSEMTIVGDKLLAMGNGVDATGHGALFARYRIGADHGDQNAPSGPGGTCTNDSNCNSTNLICRGGSCDAREAGDPCATGQRCPSGMECTPLGGVLQCWQMHDGPCNDPGESCCPSQTSPQQYSCTGNFDDGTEPGEPLVVCNNATPGLPGSCVVR